MKINRINKLTCFAGTLVLLVNGCQHSQPTSTHLHKYFEPDSEERNTTRLVETQSAAGARADSTLYPQHFDGSALSTLGVNQLDLMLKDSHNCNPLVVYLSVPADEYPSERRKAVGAYLMDRGGLKADQIEFHDGPNPHSYHASQPNLTNYDKTDTGTDTTTTGAGPASGSSSSGASH
jgi:hypothetical protein